MAGLRAGHPRLWGRAKSVNDDDTTHTSRRAAPQPAGIPQSAKDLPAGNMVVASWARASYQDAPPDVPIV